MKRAALLWCVVVGALASPALTGLANAHPAAVQDRDRREGAEHKVYDRGHKDYHVWNDAEDRAYRGWLETKHFTYRQYSKLKTPQRNDYWRWRHEHPN